jgi:hypothetical protein
MAAAPGSPRAVGRGREGSRRSGIATASHGFLQGLRLLAARLPMASGEGRMAPPWSEGGGPGSAVDGRPAPGSSVRWGGHRMRPRLREAAGKGRTMGRTTGKGRRKGRRRRGQGTVWAVLGVSMGVGRRETKEK